MAVPRPHVLHPSWSAASGGCAAAWPHCPVLPSHASCFSLGQSNGTRVRHSLTVPGSSVNALNSKENFFSEKDTTYSSLGQNFYRICVIIVSYYGFIYLLNWNINLKSKMVLFQVTVSIQPFLFYYHTFQLQQTFFPSTHNTQCLILKL